MPVCVCEDEKRRAMVKKRKMVEEKVERSIVRIRLKKKEEEEKESEKKE